MLCTDDGSASLVGRRALGAVHGYVRRSGLSVRLVDLVSLRVAQLVGCAYGIDVHSRDLLEAGMPVEHLLLVAAWPDARGIFDERERAALAWAEVVTRLGDRGALDGAFEAAAAIFGEEHLADLTIAIGLMNAFNRIAISFHATPASLAG